MKQSKTALFILIASFVLTSCFINIVSAATRESFPNDSRPAAAREARTASADFYVATDGNDAWSGKLASPNAEKTDGPFATLTRARDAVRSYRQSAVFNGKPTRIVVRGGLYELDAPFALDEADSGTPEAPILWAAAQNETVRLCGGRFLKGAQSVTDAEMRERFPQEARGKIVQIDLKALGITDYGTPNGNWAELFCDNAPQTLSRYPNEGFLRITGLVREGTHDVDIRGTKGIAEGKFQFDDERPLSWGKEKEGWVNGYWFWDWANQRQKIESIDAETKTMTLLPPNHSYGYRIGQWFYAYNLLCEIDQPGEYCIDRETGLLYFYPPTALQEDSLLLTLLPNIVTLKNVSNVTLAGFLLEGSRSTALTISGGENDALCALEVRNIGGTGISGGGQNHLIFDCQLYNLGGGGISLSGGNSKTLVSGEIAIVNNDIHDYGRIQRMYAAGIHFQGVGHYIAHNKITKAPHCAMLFGGNDHLIELNEIARVCLESNDAGAIYCGRNWTMRGNLVKNNYLHDIDGFEHRGCVGVYLDDMFSSCDTIGNLFVNVTRAAMIGGGRDNAIANNIFINCKPAIHIDARALGWCADHADGWLKEASEKGTISGVAWNKPPYSERYPKLAAILESANPKAPEGNVVEKNIIVGGTAQPVAEGEIWRGEGDSVEGKAREYATFRDNLVGVDPMFADAEKGDYRFQPGSPAEKIGFEPIPFDEIGRK